MRRQDRDVDRPKRRARDCVGGHDRSWGWGYQRGNQSSGWGHHRGDQPGGWGYQRGNQPGGWGCQRGDDPRRPWGRAGGTPSAGAPDSRLPRRWRLRIRPIFMGMFLMLSLLP